MIQLHNGLSTASNLMKTTIKTGDWEVKDAKFVDDLEVLLALTNRCQ